MPMNWRPYLAAGLAILMAAPGPAFAGQVIAAVPPSASQAMVRGTFGLGGTQAASGLFREMNRGSLSGRLQAATLLTSPVTVLVAPALSPVSLSVVAASPSAALKTPAAPGVLSGASAKLAEAKSALASGDEAGGARVAPDSTAAKGTWDAFWSRSRPAPADPVLFTDAGACRLVPLAAHQAVPQAKAVIPVSGPIQTPRPYRQLLAPLALAAAWGATRFSLASRLPGLWIKVAPYVSGAGILLASYAVNGLARRAVGALAKRLHWKPGTVMAARLATSVAVYATGGALALHAMGVPTAALLATFGIGGVAMTMAAKDFIGNFLEGVRMLLNHPFVIGDRIRIGAQDSTVRDMDLRYLSLARADGAVTMMTYSQLSEKAVTVFREYTQSAWPGAETGLRALLTASGRLASRQSLVKASLWTVLGLGVVVFLPFFPALLPLHVLTAAWSWVPYAKGVAIMLAAHFLQKGVTGFLRRLAQDRGWRPQSVVVLKLGVQLGLYLAGGALALHFLGMTWSALLKSLGATSIAVGWASADIIGNLIQGFWILTSHPFTIGDELEIGSVSGQVADMNLSCVVLKHPDNSHTLVPYAVLKASSFTVLARAAGRVQ